MHKKHTLLPCAGIAFALLLLANTSARADLIQWGYNWTPSPTKISTTNGAGYLSLTDTPSNTASGFSNTVVTNIHTYSTAPRTSPDTFSKAPVSYTLQLQDAASKASGTLKFSGYYSGTISGTSAKVQLKFTSPTTETLTLGGNTYTVTMGTYTPPGPPGASNAGSLNAYVSVAPSSGPPSGSVPEPSALMLAGLALPWVGLCGWRKRRIRR